MYSSHKKLTIFSFSKNVNNSFHQYLKNKICIKPFNINYSDTIQASLPHSARKYDLRKYFL